MPTLDALRERIPDDAKDIRVNLQNVLGTSALSPAQRAGVAITCALAARAPELARALAEDLPEVTAAVVADARAASALMAMNNVLYRFRHLVGKPVYGEKPARLRMQRITQLRGGRADFELYCLAASAIHGCESCVRSHEASFLERGGTEDQVHDAIRVAATIHAAALALEQPAF